MFSVDFMDAEGVKTRAAVFNAAVDKLFPRLLMAHCYEIYPVRAKRANPNFCQYVHELTLDVNTRVTVIVDDGTIPQVIPDFTAIAGIEKLGSCGSGTGRGHRRPLGQEIQAQCCSPGCIEDLCCRVIVG